MYSMKKRIFTSGMVETFEVLNGLTGVNSEDKPNQVTEGITRSNGAKLWKESSMLNVHADLYDSGVIRTQNKLSAELVWCGRRGRFQDIAK